MGPSRLLVVFFVCLYLHLVFIVIGLGIFPGVNFKNYKVHTRVCKKTHAHKQWLRRFVSVVKIYLIRVLQYSFQSFLVFRFWFLINFMASRRWLSSRPRSQTAMSAVWRTWWPAIYSRRGWRLQAVGARTSPAKCLQSKYLLHTQVRLGFKVMLCYVMQNRECVSVNVSW